MSEPTTARGIYDLLEADAELQGLLGTYLFQDAPESVPALAVLMPGEDLPNGTTISGVEVVISRFSAGSSAPFLTGGEMQSGEFRLYATQWSIEVGSEVGLQLEAVVQRIGQLLPGATWQPVPLSDGMGGLAQQAIRWLQPEARVRWEES